MPSNPIPNLGADPLTATGPFVPRGVALALCCVVLIAPSVASATEWSAIPSISLKLQHDDNLLLTTGPHQGVTGLTVAPRIKLAAQQENWDISGSAELRGRRYWGQNGLNRNDQIYNLSSLFRTQRTTWQLGGGYAKESVIASATFNPDIGLVSALTQRITRNVNPSWTWQMTERTQLELNFQSSLVSYQNGLASDLVNYSSRDGGATLLYQWSPRNQLTAELDRSYFKVPQTGLSQLGQPAYSVVSGGLLSLSPNPRELSNISTTDSLVLGWSHIFSQTLSGNIAIGARRTDSNSVIETCTSSTPPSLYFINGQYVGIGTCTGTTDATFSQTSSGYLYNAGLDKQFQLTHVTLSVGRQISPGGVGTQILVDTAAIGINRKLSDRLNAGLSLAGYRVRAIGTSPLPFTDRNYFNASANLRWRWTRRLTVEGDYLYIRQQFVGTTATAHDNVIYAKLDYRWFGYTLSR